MKRLVLIAILGLFATAPFALAAKPSWAKKATAFAGQCWPGKTQLCKPVRISSPDGKSSVEVRYRKQVLKQVLTQYTIPDNWILQAYLRVSTPGRGTSEAALHESFQNVDLLWSPDSQAFFVDGDGDGAPVSGFWMYVYLADNPSNPRDITEIARRDMLKEFPASKAAYPNANDAMGCKVGSRDQLGVDADSVNVTGIDWMTPSSILVMAEVPGDTLYGGIMGQVMGYELQVPTGRILKRIDAKHLKQEWQKSMAWNLRVPDPPRYCF